MEAPRRARAPRRRSVALADGATMVALSEDHRTPHTALPLPRCNTGRNSSNRYIVPST
jgi:hypothetical protein